MCELHLCATLLVQAEVNDTDCILQSVAFTDMSRNATQMQADQRFRDISRIYRSCVLFYRMCRSENFFFNFKNLSHALLSVWCKAVQRYRYDARFGPENHFCNFPNCG